MASNNSFRGTILNTLKHNKDGSFTTQANRKSILLQINKELASLGFDKVSATNFGNKHFYALRDYYQKKELSVATIKNRFACLRWIGGKLGKDLIDNQKLELENRKYSDNTKNKAKDIDFSKLEKLTERQQLAIQLQREFGLRREESLKFQPSFADKGDKLELKSSWTKGGRARIIPIRTEKQRALLERVKKVTGKGSLIEQEKSYKQAMESFTTNCQRAEIKNVHGYRHAYAQQRYKDLTGRDCPKVGGLVSKELSVEQKAQDYDTRMIISEELGHGREEITVQYLGR
jgi:ribosomal protein L24